MAFQCRHNIIMINTCSNLIFWSIIFMIKTIPFSSHFSGPQNFVGSSSFHKYLCSTTQLHPIQFMFNPTLFQQDIVVSSSFIPNPKEEKGPGFSCSRICKYYMCISLFRILPLCYYQVANCSGTACLCSFCTITDSRRPTCMLTEHRGLNHKSMCASNCSERLYRTQIYIHITNKMVAWPFSQPVNTRWGLYAAARESVVEIKF